MSAMNKNKFWGSIFFLFFCLFCSNLAQIPNHYSSILSRGCKKIRLHRWKFNIMNIFCMATKAEQFAANITHVPHCNSGVCWSSDDHEFIKRRCINTHDLLSMPLYRADWKWQVSGIPNSNFLIIANGQENILIEVIPSYIFHYRTMGFKISQCILSHLILICLLYIPKTNSAIIWSRKQNALFKWIPLKPIAFLSMSKQSKVRSDFVIDWSIRVIEIIKNVNDTFRRFRGYYFRVLRHISRAINFPLMVYLNIYLHAWLFHSRKTATVHSVSIIVEDVFFIIPCVFWRLQWDFYWTYL